MRVRARRASKHPAAIRVLSDKWRVNRSPLAVCAGSPSPPDTVPSRWTEKRQKVSKRCEAGVAAPSFFSPRRSIHQDVGPSQEYGSKIRFAPNSIRKSDRNCKPDFDVSPRRHGETGSDTQDEPEFVDAAGSACPSASRSPRRRTSVSPCLRGKKPLLSPLRPCGELPPLRLGDDLLRHRPRHFLVMARLHAVGSPALAH